MNEPRFFAEAVGGSRRRTHGSLVPAAKILRFRLRHFPAAALTDPVDDRRVILLMLPDDAEELGGLDVVLLEEGPVTAAAVHQRGRQLAVELGLGLRDQAGE